MGNSKTGFFLCLFAATMCNAGLMAQGTVSCSSLLQSFDSVLAKPLAKDNQAKMKDARKYLADYIACENNPSSPGSVSAQKKLKALEGYFDANIAGKNKGGWAQRKNLSYILVDASLQEIPSNFSNYSSVQEYYNGLALAVVKEGPCEGKNCFIDETGAVRINCTYYYPEAFAGGFAKAERGGKYGFINTEGRLAIPCKYAAVGNFSENFAMVSNDGKYGFINIYGEEIIPLQYSFASGFKNGLAKIVRDGKAGFIASSGKEVIAAAYDDAAPAFTDGLAWVRKGNKWGFIDQTGVVVVPLEYDRANSFSEGLACVIKGGKSGYINRKNEVVIPFLYEPNSVIPDFAAGLAYVIQEGKAFYIDRNGNKIRDAR